MIIAEGVNAAEGELRHAFERISQRALTEQFCKLDADLGVSVAFLIKTRFRMLRESAGDDRLIQLPSTAEHNPPTRLLT